MKWIAHRGYHKTKVENSLSAFKEALEGPYDGCECDIRITSDHAFIVYHDDTFKRLNEVTKKVVDVTLKEATQLSYLKDENEYIISLKTLLKVFHLKKKVLFIEIKDNLLSQDIQKLEHLLKKYDIPYMIISFHLDVLRQIKHFDWMWLIKRVDRHSQKMIKKHNIKHVGCHVKYMSQKTLQHLHDKHVFVSLWTVNEHQAYWSSKQIEYITTDERQ